MGDVGDGRGDGAAGDPGAADRGLIYRYYLYRITTSAGFYLPVSVLILRDKGYGLGFVGFAYAVYALGTLLSEIPTGYLGDRLGRRASLAIGCVLRVLVVGVYPFLPGKGAYLAIHLVWAAGRSFRSGTQDAWLYEILEARFDAGEFARIESRGRMARLTVSAGGAVVGSLLYGMDPSWPFLVNAGLATLGLPLLWTFPAVQGAGESSDGDHFGVGDAVTMLRAQVERPAIRWFVAYAALFHALFLVTRIYEQPAFEEIGVPVAGFGLLYAGFKLASAAAASTVGRLQAQFGVRGTFALLIPLYGVAYAGVLVMPALVVPVLFVNRGLSTITAPLRNQYLNDRLADVGRSTVLSGAAMAMALVGGVARVVAGAAADGLGAVALLGWSGVVIAPLGALLWVTKSPVRTSAPDGATARGSGSTATD
ncbi:major facilitator superfamily protein [Halolamina pelagica]|uniref:Major facilitator superfamily protein n=1 Tax=Halolamina pelagica TaxID=699431 RepID=A0A0P7FXR8_9EURY|nr:MFS transporter [Halolamina pelagica]KPN32034.1 major facilitator superfamily protein [Halolamina pelagica]